jgi:SHS2 domain-containing protein
MKYKKKFQLKIYRAINHTSELAFIVYGKTKKQLFVNAFLLVNKIITPKKEFTQPQLKTQKQIKKIIKISSPNNNTLLVDFLNQVLSQSQIKKSFYKKIKWRKFIPLNNKNKLAQLEAEIIGFPINKFQQDIKAITYHDVQIKKNKNDYWYTKIIFDI